MAAAPALVKRKRKGLRLFRLGEEIPKAAYFIIAALSFLIPIAAWCYFSYSGKEPPFILPTPTAVFQAFQRELIDELAGEFGLSRS